MVIIAVSLAGVLTLWLTKKPAIAPMKNINQSTNTSTVSPANTNAPDSANTNISPPIIANASVTPTPAVVVPMADFYSRVTKKPFGIYITPATSPIQPEKFTGYHTGADAETTATEQKIDVPISAIANGTVVFAGHVNGYGGVIIIEHKIGTEKITALYGHVRQSSILVKVHDQVHPGDRIAVLGTGYTSETDGERKHLHLGILKGYVINYKGYVEVQSALSAWHDPVAWLKAHGA